MRAHSNEATKPRCNLHKVTCLIHAFLPWGSTAIGMPTFAYCGSESAQVICCEFFPEEDGRLEYRQALTVDANPLGLKDGAPDGIAGASVS